MKNDSEHEYYESMNNYMNRLKSLRTSSLANQRKLIKKFSSLEDAAKAGVYAKLDGGFSQTIIGLQQ